MKEVWNETHFSIRIGFFRHRRSAGCCAVWGLWSAYAGRVRIVRRTAHSQSDCRRIGQYRWCGLPAPGPDADGGLRTDGRSIHGQGHNHRPLGDCRDCVETAAAHVPQWISGRDYRTLLPGDRPGGSGKHSGFRYRNHCPVRR